MPSNVTLISTTSTSELSPGALAQIIPSSVQLPITSQFPAVSIVQSADGSPSGISGYAYGYASVAPSGFDSVYDAGSNNFSQNVSDMTLGQIIYALNSNTTTQFGAVQINYTKLQTLVLNNPSLYLTNTIFSPDIQSAMMTDLAIVNTSTSAASYAKTNYNLPGVSNALAYYAAQYGIDPLLSLKSYDPNNTTVTIGSIFVTPLMSASTEIKNATMYAVVNGLPKSQGGLGTFQGFNSWNIYPSNMTGTNSNGQYIQAITIPGRGNNPGLTNNSNEPVNAIGYGLDQLNFLTQQSLTQALNIINSLNSGSPGGDGATLTVLATQANSALALTTSSTSTYSAATSPTQTETIAQATAILTSAYNAYQADTSNAILESNLNIAISNFIQVETGSVNLNTSVNSAYSQLNLAVISLANLIINELNSFPPLQSLNIQNPNYLTQSFSNSTIEGSTLNAATTVVSGNIGLVSNSASVPSFVTNPALAIYTTIGQQIELSPDPSVSNVNTAGNMVYQNVSVNSGSSDSPAPEGSSITSAQGPSTPGPGASPTTTVIQYITNVTTTNNNVTNISNTTSSSPTTTSSSPSSNVPHSTTSFV